MEFLDSRYIMHFSVTANLPFACSSSSYTTNFKLVKKLYSLEKRVQFCIYFFNQLNQLSQAGPLNFCIPSSWQRRQIENLADWPVVLGELFLSMHCPINSSVNCSESTASSLIEKLLFKRGSSKYLASTPNANVYRQAKQRLAYVVEKIKMLTEPKSHPLHKFVNLGTFLLVQESTYIKNQMNLTNERELDFAALFKQITLTQSKKRPHDYPECLKKIKKRILEGSTLQVHAKVAKTPCPANDVFEKILKEFNVLQIRIEYYLEVLKLLCQGHSLVRWTLNSFERRLLEENPAMHAAFAVTRAQLISLDRSTESKKLLFFGAQLFFNQKSLTIDLSKITGAARMVCDVKIALAKILLGLHNEENPYEFLSAANKFKEHFINWRQNGIIDNAPFSMQFDTNKGLHE